MDRGFTFNNRERSTPETPKFNGDFKDSSLVRAVIESALRTVDADVSMDGKFGNIISSYATFTRAQFNHEAFQGKGKELLDAADISDEQAFLAYMTNMFPEDMANALLAKDDLSESSLRRLSKREESIAEVAAINSRSVEDDVQHIMDGIHSNDPVLREAAIEALNTFTVSEDGEASISLEDLDAFVGYSVIEGAWSKLSKSQQDVINRVVKDGASIGVVAAEMKKSEVYTEEYLRRALLDLYDLIPRGKYVDFTDYKGTHS